MVSKVDVDRVVLYKVVIVAYDYHYRSKASGNLTTYRWYYLALDKLCAALLLQVVRCFFILVPNVIVLVLQYGNTSCGGCYQS